MVMADYDGRLDPGNPLSGLVGSNADNGKPIWSAEQSAAHILRPRGTWSDLDADLVISYSFETDVQSFIDSGSNPYGAVPYFQPYSAVQQAYARSIFDLIADVSGLSFVETAADQGQIQLYVATQISGAGGFADYPGSGTSHNWIANYDLQFNRFGSYTLLHELGHSLGLAHSHTDTTGGYTGSAEFFQDSRLYTTMSYWGAENNNETNVPHASAPLLYDILSLQQEYGSNMSTRTGDTVYGYNSTAGRDAFDFTLDTAPSVAIWDAGGIDTLDFSGSASGTRIDLREGSFSSVNGYIDNIAIAYGATIEDAVGSGRDDSIRGNETGNSIHGGQGHDVIRGGTDLVPDFAVDPRHFTGIEINSDPLVRDQYLQVDNIQSFSGSAFTIELMVDLVRASSQGIQFVSYAVSGSADEFLISSQGSGGNLKVTINGVVYTTTIPEERLVDGQPHRLSVSWNSTDGALDIYIDGALADSTTHQAGAPLAIGGTLVFGQDQDSVGGGFQARQVLQGTIGDIRIFDHVRTQSQINDNQFTTLTGNEAGLLNNWQVQAGDTTIVTDVAVANPSINLTDLLPASFTITQSSSYNASSGADLVLDNNTGTFNHTQNSGNEWLLLAFDQPRDITTVSFQNRPTWGNRLNGATVSVLDDQGNVLYISAPITGAIDGEVFSFSFPGTLTASAVRIDQTTNFLHIAELNVFGPAPAGVAVDPALLNTDLTIHSGTSGTLATVNNTAPVVDTTPDNDILYGEQGNDVLHGGWGNDTLYGHGGNTALDSPFAAATAITLNQDGASNQYLEIANYNGIAGAGNSIQFTVEMLVEGLSVGYSPLLSYAHYVSSNGFLVEIGTNGNFQIYNFGGLLDTGISAAGLTDGGMHRFSLSWDGASAAGEFVIYIDGVEIGRGTHPRQNWQINSNGTLIFGQEQDSIGGGFQTSQILEGSISDIRIFNDIRTAQEVTSNAFSSLDAAGLADANLVNNWQVDADSLTNHTVVDAAGGTALTIQGYSAPAQFTLTPAIEAIHLNNNRATNQSLSIDSTDALSGGAFTLEFMVALGASFNNRSTLATYGPNYAMELEFRGTATLLLSLPGAGFFDTGIALTALQAAGAHRISISWDSATGAIAAYLDGVVQNSGVHGAGATLAAGGRLAFGQDLNSGGNLANAGDDISIGDIRIFNDVRTAGEIATHAAQPLDAAGLADANLVNNWQVDASSIPNGAVVDVTGGTSLTLAGSSAPTATQVGAWDNDTLMGGGGTDQLFGGAGIDHLFGGLGDDTLYGGDGDDIINAVADAPQAARETDANTGIVTIFEYHPLSLDRGEQGNDSLFGDLGDDLLYGGGGTDSLDGGAGNDALYGGIDNDTLIGGFGNDTLTGGEGADLFVFGDGWGTDIISDFSIKQDKIDFTGNSTINSMADLLITYNQNEALITTTDGVIILTGLTPDLTDSDFLF